MRGGVICCADPTDPTYEGGACVPTAGDGGVATCDELNSPAALRMTLPRPSVVRGTPRPDLPEAGAQGVGTTQVPAQVRKEARVGATTVRAAGLAITARPPTKEREGLLLLTNLDRFFILYLPHDCAPWSTGNVSTSQPHICIVLIVLDV